jgi:Tol biopolymer transport system component
MNPSSSTSSIRLASTMLAAFAFVSCSSPESATQTPTPAAPVTMTSFLTVQTNNPDADWSPDGRWISYADTRDREARDIWIRPVDGGDAIQVTDDPADDRVARWSPDGDRLLFRSDRGAA